MALILLYKCCKFGEKICNNSRDIEFFLGDYFFGAPCTSSHRRIGVVSATHAMQRCWRQQTEIEFGHQTATLRNLCSSDFAVRCRYVDLLVNNIRRLQSFHMGCQRQILGVRWQDDHVKNVDTADTTGLPNITRVSTNLIK